MISKEEINELPDVSNAREPMAVREGKFYVVKNKGLFEIFDPGVHDKKLDHYNPLIFKHFKPVAQCLSAEATIAALSLMS